MTNSSTDEKFRLTVEFAPHGVLVTNEEGIIQLVNRELEKLFGYNREELLGKSVDILVLEKSRSGHQQQVKGFAQSGTARRMGELRDVFGRRKDGSTVPVEIGLTPIRIAQNFIIVASVVDITERKKLDSANQRFELVAKELLRSNSELQQFAFVASHDLQAPLRHIGIYTDFLAEAIQSSNQKDINDALKTIHRSVARMKTLIDDLLAFSRVGGKLDLVKVDLRSRVNDIIETLSEEINQSSAEVSIAPLPTLVCDPKKIGQIFQNLIQNSIKYRRDHVRPIINISFTESTHEFTFCVEDNGIGIRNEFVGRIFNIFQRLHGPDKYPGNGIGLAICKKVVELHNGKIWIESVEGVGSKFLFVIPKNLQEVITNSDYPLRNNSDL